VAKRVAGVRRPLPTITNALKKAAFIRSSNAAQFQRQLKCSPVSNAAQMQPSFVPPHHIQQVVVAERVAGARRLLPTITNALKNAAFKRSSNAAQFQTQLKRSPVSFPLTISSRS
jgi:hypothetical protein